MKLSQLRPCDRCGKPLADGSFYVVRTSLAMVKPSAANQTLGLMQMFGGGRMALGIAEAMSPEPEIFTVFGDEDKQLMDEFYLCQVCYTLEPINLAGLSERVNQRDAS